MTSPDTLFSINSLPNDEEFLRDLLAAVNAKLGNRSVNLHDELVENMEVARRLRDQLTGISLRERSSLSTTSSRSGSGSGWDDDYDDRQSDSGFEDVKDSSKVASVRAFTDIIEKLVKMQDVVLSQQGIAALQGAVVEVLMDVDPELQRHVMLKFRERIADLEGRRR
jgi:hypothetical protein